MGLFSDRFIHTYEGHTIEVEGYYEDLSSAKLKFKLLVNNEHVDEVYLQFGTATLRCTEHQDSNKYRPMVTVLIKQYLWSTAYILEGIEKIKMKRLH